jgi:predicted O-methyltransferase YrrM
MIDSGGVETDVGEFIYSLTRMIKPLFVLETGTYHGLSAGYIGLALKANRKGTIVTLDPYVPDDGDAYKLWNDLEIRDIVTHERISSLDYVCQPLIDVLFLDSEPHLRFKEFVRFFDRVVPGGIIMIHDLHPHLSYTGMSINGITNWPYGDFRETLGPYIKNCSVQVVSFPTPRGFTMFQKNRNDFSATRHLKGEI